MRIFSLSRISGALMLAALAGTALAPQARAENDPDAGRRVFGQCMACHSIAEGAPGRIGPNLRGVVGRAAGSIEGFRYSPNMREIAATGYVWDEAHLAPYLADPKSVLPRGFMAFPGLRNPEQISDVIAYLRTQR